MIKKILSLLLFAIFISGISAQADTTKIAIVDVPKIVNNSAQVKALQKEQDAKKAELVKFIKNARVEINKQTDPKKKEALTQKYNKELDAKREANAKAYKTKLEAIDKNITSAIVTQAKAQGYDIVLTKGVVLYGGDDITESISKVVK